MVNNGSVDRTLEKMLSLKQMDSNIKIVDLRNNFGYQSSISAGLFNADNDLIISIDADLQDDPSKIKEMIEWLFVTYRFYKWYITYDSIIIGALKGGINKNI